VNEILLLSKMAFKKEKCFVLFFVVFLDSCILHAVLNTSNAAALLRLCRHHFIILKGRGMITLIFRI